MVWIIAPSVLRIARAVTAERTTAEPSEARSAPRPVGPALPAGLPGQLLALQRTAGNAAVRALIQRKIAPGDLPGKKPSEAMADETYLDNNMVKLEFYDAQAAVVHYKDGSKLSLGLVPEHIKPPVEGVDYRSTSHMRVMGDAAGKLSFVPRAQEIVMKMPDTAPAGDLLKFARDVTFKHDPASGRIVPTEVNSITAPRLCQLLRESEADYVRDFDAFAKGGEKVMKKLEIVVILASLLSGPKPRAAGGAAAGAATSAARAEATLLSFLKNVLQGGGAKGAQLAVEGVEIGGVEAGVQGSRFFVRYSHIINSGRVAGQGRLVQTALEKAAIAAGKEAGAKTVEVGVTTIVNPAWQAYLESMGYVPEMVQVAATQWTKVWMRVFTL
jgi:hypothetical protein